MKKLILFVIDALASRIFVAALNDGKLPNIQALTTHGIFREQCISIFPTITPAALSSIITGHYPIHTGIPGDYWYDEQLDTVKYFGADFSAIMGEGLEPFLKDFLINLNNDSLKPPTLFEILQTHDLQSACLNFFIHRGTYDYEIELPSLLSFLPIPSPTLNIKGPALLHLGDLHHINIDEIDFSIIDSIQGRFGFDDETTLKILKFLITHDQLPDFTVAYLPNNDWDSHELGPENAVFNLENIDRQFGELFEASGGIEQFLHDHTVFLVGDHAQTALDPDEEKRGINLDQVLKDFHLVPAGESWEADEDIVACPNLRSTLFYFKRVTSDHFYRVVDSLLADDRIDQAIWRSSILGTLESGYYIKNARHGQLHFRHDPDSPMAYDHYGAGWSWEGDLAVVDAQVSSDGIITFDTYPNAFERIKNVLDLERSGDLWATAKPGHTFHLESMEFEERGSHGTLHYLDSTTVFLIAGHDESLTIPDNMRIVDVAPLILDALGINTQSAGRSHIQTDNP